MPEHRLARNGRNPFWRVLDLVVLSEGHSWERISADVRDHTVELSVFWRVIGLSLSLFPPPSSSPPPAPPRAVPVRPNWLARARVRSHTPLPPAHSDAPFAVFGRLPRNEQRESPTESTSPPTVGTKARDRDSPYTVFRGVHRQPDSYPI